ncbi:MAG: MFS transporter [Chitinophagaceae bacterium]|nr:MFS transporter [Chitinophagaceae bacterium]
MSAESPAVSSFKQVTVYPVLMAISFSHLLNDTIQSLIPSLYPLIKTSYNLNFTQIGIITLTFNIAASLLQPFVGAYTDKKPQPFSLATAMAVTFVGLFALAWAPEYWILLVAAAMIGVGSSIFHPEASKVAYLAAGAKRGLAQSIFQVGGNAGSALGPLLAAIIIVPRGQKHVQWFSLLAILAIIVLYRVGKWYSDHLSDVKTKKKMFTTPVHSVSKKRVVVAVIILLVLIFSKYFYLACMSSYYTFYLMHRFNASVQSAQLHLFIFLAAVAAGTLAGGSLGDKFGRKYVIWWSILGAAPFTILLPYVSLPLVTLMSIFIGFILASAFSAILVYAQELIPGKIGTISGLFFGFAFGMGGIGSAALGILADHTSLEYMFYVCSFLPLLGLLTVFLPNLPGSRRQVS